MKVINVHQAKTQLSQYLEQVAAGEELIIGKNNKPIAKLVPYIEEKPERVLGGVEGWVSNDCWDTDPEIEELVYKSPLFPEQELKVAEETVKYNENPWTTF